jgi:hypothetical protein|tara:strand:+ start:317 stop:595 length:279 start_codon:yes stop_codon:yes gene_type:complete
MGLKLSDVSPLASLVEGEGIMEYAGVVPAYLTRKRKKKKARREEERLASEKAEADRLEKVTSDSTTMSAGGKTRTKPIDGIAIKGKTRGRMI